MIMIALALLATMALASLGLALLGYTMTCELRHSIADLQTAFLIGREGGNSEQVRGILAPREPAKKGDVRIHVPNCIKTPFEL